MRPDEVHAFKLLECRDHPDLPVFRAAMRADIHAVLPTFQMSLSNSEISCMTHVWLSPLLSSSTISPTLCLLHHSNVYSSTVPISTPTPA
jgi:hypothetical protein